MNENNEQYSSRLLEGMGFYIEDFLSNYVDTRLHDPKFNEDAIRILNERYFIKDDDGNVIEDVWQFLARVALGVQYAYILRIRDGHSDTYDMQYIYETAADYFNIMADLDFLPNSPTLMNAGTPMGQLAACFVVPVEDSMDGIYDAVKSVALIHQSGGGTGMDFSNLRPEGSPVKSTQGVASGPISFMKVFDISTEQIKQGGKRRGANMGMLRVDHPDIEKFIVCKDDDKSLQNFNISVAITDEFMRALDGQGPLATSMTNSYLYSIRDPKTGEEVGTAHAGEVWNMIVQHAWNTGDPGIVFIDAINGRNPFRIDQYPEHIMHATNPCGEQPLEPYEACNLGSINLINFIDSNTFGASWDKTRLSRVIHTAVRFLDDVVESGNYPMDIIRDRVQRNRKVGLGVMGFADSLIACGVHYGSTASLQIAEDIMKFIDDVAHMSSKYLSDERGAFPSFSESVYAHERRNATLTTIAPTGTISMLANGTSSGVEPVFSFAFTKKVMGGQKFFYVHPELKKIPSITDEEIQEIIDNGGRIPDALRELYGLDYMVGAMEVTPQEHIYMQAAFQKYVDNAVSKTINLPNDATADEIDAAYRLAYQSGCKGTTIYRDGSKSDQVLFTGSKSENNNSIDLDTMMVGDTPVLVANDAEILQMIVDAVDRPDQYELVPIDEYKILLEGHECSCDKNHEPAVRPEVMIGVTVKTDTPCGRLYVTINTDEDGNPFEVFCKLGKSGACAGAVQETMGRLISQELRSGGDMAKIIKQLRGASCGQSVGMGPKRVTSCIDAIGVVLQRYADGDIHNQVIASDEMDDVDTPVDRPVDLPDGPGALLMTESVHDTAPVRHNGACDVCGSGAIEREGGCFVCRSCGHSKCA